LEWNCGKVECNKCGALCPVGSNDCGGGGGYNRGGYGNSRGVDLITTMEEEVMTITVVEELTVLVEVGEATVVVKAEAEVHRQS